MNLVDRNAKDFTEATIAYQNTYQFDFIKLMPKMCIRDSMIPVPVATVVLMVVTITYKSVLVIVG